MIVKFFFFNVINMYKKCSMAKFIFCLFFSEKNNNHKYRLKSYVSLFISCINNSNILPAISAEKPTTILRK